MKFFRLLFFFSLFSASLYSQQDVAITNISLAPAGPYSYGDAITFTISIRNNGPASVKNVTLQDVIPCGLSYAGGSQAWSPTGNNRITTYTGTIVQNQTVTLSIDLIVQPCITLNAWLNSVSITGYLDINDNNIFSADDNTTNNLFSSTPPIYDLALRKNLATPPPYQYGNVLTFNIEVFNQGNQTVNGFLLNDYLPIGAGYMFEPLSNPTWSGGPTTYSKFVMTPILPGSMHVETIQLRLLRTNGGARAWVNYAEIAAFYDQQSNPAFDADSSPNSDTNQERDVLPASANDNNLNSTGLANNDDDDDHDPAGINIFDLALTKTQGSALISFSYLQDVEYVFTIYNQGSIPATNIEVTDYLSPGLQYMATPKNTNRGWVYNNLTHSAKVTYNKILLPGQSDTLKLDLMPIQYYTDPDNAWTDFAEISDANDTDPNTAGKPVDLDSTPDSVNGNDAGGRANSPSDNAINGNATGTPGDAVAATDEDDHDSHKIQIFDLAIRKTKVTAGTFFQAGQDVTFNITIFNQGNVPTKNITISDYVPAGFDFIAGGANVGWAGNEPLITYNMAATLFPNTNTTLSVTLRVQATAAAGAYLNYAEVSAAMDTMNNNRNDDADSVTDNIPGNDNQVLPGSPNDDNILGNSFTGGDEDDHDVSGIELLCQKPTLTVGIPECDPGNGTYSVTYYSNVANITTAGNIGTVGAAKITGIPIGTDVIIVATNGPNCTQSLTVVRPANCPGTNGCTYPKLTVGQPLCNTSSWSVSFTTDLGTVVPSLGNVSGNSIVNIPFNQNLNISSTNGTCVTTVNVTAPTNCGVPCANSPISISGPVCDNSGAGTYSINYIVAAGTNVQASTGTLNTVAGTITGIQSGTNLTLTVTTPGCITRVIVVPAGNCPVCQKPTLTVGIPECDPGNGTYSVTYYSNVANITTAGNIGIVGATKITGIPIGTDVTIVATNGPNCIQSLTVVRPANCPGTNGCTYPKLTVGQPFCGQSSWSVSFTTDLGTVVPSLGNVSGNSIINIPFGQNITVTSTNGTCVTTENVTAPTNCGIPCANSPISISGPVCDNSGAGTYSINYIVAAGTNVQASTGTLNTVAGTVTGIQSGTNLTLTVTTPGCITRVIVVPAGNCPVCQKPTLTVGIPECDPGNGTYSVTYYSNVTTPNISVNSGGGVIGATKISGITIGTSITITANNGANCSQSLTVQSPPACPGTNGCTYPRLTVGQPLCGQSSWSVSFTNDLGLVVPSHGNVSGNSIINIPFGQNITVTATNGTCVTAENVTAPTNCGIPCANSPISISGPVCETGAATYKVNYIVQQGTTVQNSVGTLTAGMVTGIPSGQILTLTVTTQGCITRTIAVPAGDCVIGNGSISNFVWHDINGDGQQNPGEPGLPGIIVMLYHQITGFVAQKTTAAGGLYIFNDVPPGNYYVRILPPAGWDITFSDIGNDLSDSDFGNFNGPGTTAIFTLNSGQNNSTIDAGLYRCAPIGDLVWYDSNKNNVYNSNENGINGLRVYLWKNHFGTWRIWDNKFTGSKPGSPSEDGYFLFCAPPGEYYVEVVMPPLGLVRAAQNVGNNEEIDSDIDAQGKTNTFIVLSGVPKTDLGAGYYPMAVAGNLVWRDDNINGRQDAGETKVKGVKVEAIEIANGTVAASTFTNNDGAYTLDYLENNRYYLRFTVPSGYSATIPAATDDAMDSDVNHSYGLNTTGAYIFESGMTNNNIDLGIAFGVLPVNWLEVTAKYTGGVNVVQWKVAGEINVSHYVVERKGEGDTEFTEKPEIVNVQRDGKFEVQYIFKDSDILQGKKYYYRIKQYDFDGKYSYSKIVSAESDENLYLQMYPNPASDFAVLEIKGDIADMHIELLDSEAKLVRKINVVNNRTNIDLNGLTKGVYTVRVKSGISVMSDSRLIVIK